MLFYKETDIHKVNKNNKQTKIRQKLFFFTAHDNNYIKWDILYTFATSKLYSSRTYLQIMIFILDIFNTYKTQLLFVKHNCEKGGKKLCL